MYSLWLLPAAADEAKLNAIVRLLADRHKAPSFRAHLTLLGDIPGGGDDPRGALQTIAATAPAFSVPVAAIELSDAYFMSFYARFPLLPALERLKAASVAAIGHGSVDGFVPHVSLLYGPVPEPEKERSAEGLRRDLVAQPVTFDRIAVVRSAKDVPIEEWAVLDECPLSGEAG